MNKLLNKILLFGTVVAVSTFGLSAENTISATNQEVMEQMDQPYCYLQTAGKYPTLYKCNPANKELVIVLCGTEKKDGEIDFAKKPADLEKLTPLRMKDMFYNMGTLLDKKYMRESITSSVLAEIFQLMQIMPKESYKGQVLWEEVSNGTPMKWTLKNKAELVSLLVYLGNKQALSNKKISRKPMLALFFVEETTLTDEDKAAIGLFFELVQTTNADVKEFYKTCDTNLNTFLDYQAKKIVGESWGELVLRQIETPFEEFDMKKLTAKITSSHVVWLIGTILTYKILVEPLVDGYIAGPLKTKIWGPKPAPDKK